MKFFVLTVGYLGKCLWSLMNCRKERIRMFEFWVFFPVVWTGRICKSLHSHEVNANCLARWR